MLQNPSLTPELKQQMLDQVTDAVMLKLGFDSHDNKIIATDKTAPDGSRILGFYSEQTGNAYINDPENDSISELVVTAGHEASHSIDHQSDIENSTQEGRYDNNIYAENFGENLASYTDFALSANGYDGLAISNDHASNDSALTRSNAAVFDSLDYEQGDFRLSELQKNTKNQELEACQSSVCSQLVQVRYSVISSVQGAAEVTGVAAGAVSQVIEDLKDFIQIVDELIEDPEKAEAAAEALNVALLRANEVIEGDQLSDAEKENFSRAINNFAEQIITTAEDATILDGEGAQASFDEGKKYGIYAASIIPLSKISKYLKSISLGDSSAGVSSHLDPIDFNVDSEASGHSPYDLFRNTDGTWNWPENNGFEKNTVRNETLNIGTRLDRYGSSKGSFLAPEFTPNGQRSLAPVALAAEYNVYEVIKPLPIISGKTEPWFGQIGGGTQYMTVNPTSGDIVSVEWLINNNYIRAVD